MAAAPSVALSLAAAHPHPRRKKNKRPGRKPGFKKSVTFADGRQQQSADAQEATADVEMMDVDPATEMDPAPQNDVAREIEKAESTIEAVTMAHVKEERNNTHALPADAAVTTSTPLPPPGEAKPE